MFGGFRGSNPKKEILNEMLALEVEQLFYTDPNLFQYADTNELTQEVKEKLYNSPLASERLKQGLKYHLSFTPETMRSADLNIKSTSRSFKIETLNGDLTIHTNNHTKIKKLYESSDNKGLIASYEIDLLSDTTRSGEVSNISIHNNWEDKDIQMLIIGKDENGIDHYTWVTDQIQVEDELKDNNLIRGVKNTNGIININVNRNRGVFTSIKKFIVNVIRALKDDAASDLEGLLVGKIEYGQMKWKTISSLQKVELERIKKEQSKGNLLFIHGTFSSVEDSFRDLFANIDFLKTIDQKYDTILGFNHSSVKSSISKNVESLNTEIKTLGLDKDKFKVISTSRGGLIAREVFAKSDAKLILSACPNLGTPMADKQNIKELLDRFTKLTALVGLSSPLIPVIAKAVSFLASEVWNFDGISDMAPDSPFISKLASLTGNEILIGIDHNSKGIRSAIDIANDNFIFGGEYNDMVVPLESSTNKYNANAKYFKDETSTHHLSYFKNETIVSHIIANV